MTVVPAASPAADALALEPDGVFLSNGPGDPAALPDAGRRSSPTCSAGCRCSGSASATSCWPRPSGHAPTSSPSATTAGNHPVRRLDTGQVEITSQNHNYAVDGATLPTIGPERGRGHPRQPERRRGRGLPLHRGAGLQRAVPPRGRARARTTPATSSSEFRRHDRRGAAPDAAPNRHRDDPRHRLGPDRHRPGVRVRLLGHPGLPGAAGRGVPGRARQLQSGHDHDRPASWPTAPTSSRSTSTC